MKAFFSKIWKWVLANKVLAGIIGGASVVALTLAIVLPITLSKHTHTFEEVWLKDATSHWHAATCGHDEKGDEANHTFGNWIVLSETKDKRTCSVCGYAEERNHEHTFAEEWSHDDTQHWHAATCGHKVTDSLAGHTFSNWTQKTDNLDYDTRSCSVCGYIEERDHEHYYSSDWEYDYLHHWHNASCSHTSEKDEYEEHLIPTKKIGTYSDGYGNDYDVYKDTCDCGLTVYEVFDVSGDTPYYLTVESFTLPTTQKEGSITFYPDCKTYDTTLTISKIGDNRIYNNGFDLAVDRAYDVSVKGTKCYAQVNPWAYNLSSSDNEFNFHMAVALSQDPQWKFEIDGTTYDKSRKVVDWTWKEEPYGSDAGVIALIYEDGDHEDIEIASLISTSDWYHSHINQGTYTDELEIYHFKENASCLSLVDDVYLRKQIMDFLAYNDDYNLYGFHHSATTIADKNGALSTGPAFYEDDAMLVRIKVEYGKLQKNADLFYYDAFDKDGNPTGSVKSCKIAAFLTVKNDGGVGSMLDAGLIYANNKEYWIALTGTGLSADKENLFCSEEYNIVFSASDDTHLAYMYSHIGNLIFW